MRVRAHHLQCFLFGLLALIGLQIALFDKIFECAGHVDEGVPLRFRNLRQGDTVKLINQQETAVENSADDDFEAASGCILVCDDNHFLIGKLSTIHISCRWN